MPATFDRVAHYARQFPGVKEGASFGTPALHVGKKFMARLKEDGETLVIRCPMEQRTELLAAYPDVFFMTDHYRDYAAVLVNLMAVRDAMLRERVEQAWRMLASPKVIAKWEAGKDR